MEQADVLQEAPTGLWSKLFKPLIAILIIGALGYWGIQYSKGIGVGRYIGDDFTIAIEDFNVDLGKSFYFFGSDEIKFSGRQLSGYIQPVSGKFKIKVTDGKFKATVKGLTTMSETWTGERGTYSFKGHGIKGSVTVSKDPSLGRLHLQVSYRLDSK